MKPVNDNLIIQLPPVETVTESGFMIPESAVKVPQTATVIAVADDQTKVKAGDKLIIRQHAGQTFEHDGDTYQLIHLSDVMVILGK
jgi:co-chaperonin GroES (HSP10)